MAKDLWITIPQAIKTSIIFDAQVKKSPGLGRGSSKTIEKVLLLVGDSSLAGLADLGLNALNLLLIKGLDGHPLAHGASAPSVIRQGANTLAPMRFGHVSSPLPLLGRFLGGFFFCLRLALLLSLALLLLVNLGNVDLVIDKLQYHNFGAVLLAETEL